MPPGLLRVLQGNCPDKRGGGSTQCLSELPGKTAGGRRKKAPIPPDKSPGAIAGMENDPGEEYIKNPESGETIGFENDLVGFPGFLRG